jgi:hypothetical protein
VIIVRQRIGGGIARERRVAGKQLRLELAGASVHEGDRIAPIIGPPRPSTGLPKAG